MLISLPVTPMLSWLNAMGNEEKSTLITVERVRETAILTGTVFLHKVFLVRQLYDCWPDSNRATRQECQVKATARGSWVKQLRLLESNSESRLQGNENLLCWIIFQADEVLPSLALNYSTLSLPSSCAYRWISLHPTKPVLKSSPIIMFFLFIYLSVYLFIFKEHPTSLISSFFICTKEKPLVVKGNCLRGS